MLNRVLKIAGVGTHVDRETKLYNDLIRHEGQIGGTLFGKVPKGARREFFCLDKYTWVWHEEWKDKEGKQKTRTTRYSVRPDSIVKTQDGKHYQRITDDEAARFYDAVMAYERRVLHELYQVA